MVTGVSRTCAELILRLVALAWKYELFVPGFVGIVMFYRSLKTEYCSFVSVVSLDRKNSY